VSHDLTSDQNERDPVPFPPGATRQMAGNPASPGGTSQSYQYPQQTGPGFPQQQPAQYGPQQPQQPRYVYPGPHQQETTGPLPQQPFFPPNEQQPPAQFGSHAQPGLYYAPQADWSQARQMLNYLRSIDKPRLVAMLRLSVAMLGIESPTIEHALLLIEQSDLADIFAILDSILARLEQPRAAGAYQPLGIGETAAIVQLFLRLLLELLRDPQTNAQTIRVLMAG